MFNYTLDMKQKCLKEVIGMISINKDKFILALANISMPTEMFSKESGVSRTVVSKIINGHISSVRIQTAGRLAKALNCKVEDLI